MKNVKEFLFVVAFAVTLFFPGDATAKLGDRIKARRAAKSQTSCVGPNCTQQVGSKGPLSINDKGGFEGQLPSTSYADYIARKGEQPDAAPAAKPETPGPQQGTVTACVDANADGTCDRCGGAMSTEAVPIKASTVKVASDTRTVITQEAAIAKREAAIASRVAADQELAEADRSLALAGIADTGERSVKAAELNARINLLEKQQDDELDELRAALRQLAPSSEGNHDPAPAN